MTCQEARELQGNYLDEELIDSARATLEKHLDSCPQCTADFAAVADAIGHLKAGARQGEPGTWFADRVLDRLARENETTNSPLAVDDPSQMSFADL